MIKISYDYLEEFKKAEKLVEKTIDSIIKEAQKDLNEKTIILLKKEDDLNLIENVYKTKFALYDKNHAKKEKEFNKKRKKIEKTKEFLKKYKKMINLVKKDKEMINKIKQKVETCLKNNEALYIDLFNKLLYTETEKLAKDEKITSQYFI